MSQNHTLVLPFVNQATGKFVQAEAMREVMSLLLVSGKGAIWYGPGGHAKSQFARSVFQCIDGASIMVVNCHPDLDVADLFGGIDLNALEREGDRRIQFNVDQSWLNRDMVIFEEMLDTPAKTMAALKNTLTERQLQNGAQVADMHTGVMIALTNKKPQDVVEFVDEASRASIAALMERFPLQMVVEWTTYGSADYLAMFQTLETALDECPEFSYAELLELRQQMLHVRIPRDILAVLTELIAEANQQSGGIISPRTAVHAKDLIAAAAIINGRNYAIEEDIIAVKYLPGMEAIAATIQQKIEAASGRAKADDLLRDGFRIAGVLGALLERRRGQFEFTKAAMALLQQLLDEMDEKIRPPKELQDRKSALRSEIEKLLNGTGIARRFISEARVSIPAVMLGVDWKVVVEKSELTLSQQLHLREQEERDRQLEAENAQIDDEWENSAEEDYDDDDDYDDEDDDDVLNETVVNKLRKLGGRDRF